MHGNGALVPHSGRMSRQMAMLDRMAFTGEADVRAREQMDKDELEMATLAAKVNDAKRAMEKYGTSLASIAELLRRMETQAMTAAEIAINEQMVREHEAVMVAAITEFCGGNVDAKRIVADDVDKLRQSIQGGNGRRGRVSRKPHADFDVQED